MINLKDKKELTFLIIGILMLLIVVAIVSLAINFLIGNLNRAVNTRPDVPAGSLRFDIENAESLINQ
jgi:hypothetical protein